MAAESPIRLGRGSLLLKDSQEEIQPLREEFDRYHSVRLQGFLDPPLLHEIRERVDQARFYERTHDKVIALELCMRPNGAFHLLKFLMNQPRLLRVVEAITGCGSVGCFTGRIYRLQSDREHFFRWHSDMVEQRLIGVTLNLSREAYQGGLLQIRDKTSRRIVREWANVGFGDCILFRISGTLEHRVTHVEGAVPKISLAGWFQSQPNFGSLFKQDPLFKTGKPKGFLDKLQGRVEVPREVAFAADGQEGFLFEARRGLCCRLNAEGRRFWEFLAQFGDLEAAFRGMKDEFDVRPADLEKDLLQLAGELQSKGLLRVRRE